MKFKLALLTALAAVVVAGCGGSSDSTTTEATTTTDLAAQNDAVIENAQQAPDAVAAQGEAEIRATLTKKLDMTKGGDIHGDGFDCYVKTGADAQSFSYQKKNILYDPSGSGDLIFVQTYTNTPLADCLIEVSDALGW